MLNFNKLRAINDRLLTLKQMIVAKNGKNTIFTQPK
jgi:hypothetical protein